MTQNGAATPQLEARVEQLRLEADGVISLQLVAADGGALPPWEPGAHIDLGLPNGATRQYSLCGDPAAGDRYCVGVLREQASSGGSEYVHMFLRPGRRVRIGGPRNHFALGDHERYIFIAGGIGITPILAMAHHVAAATREWTLFYAGRSTKSMAFLDELAEFGP